MSSPSLSDIVDAAIPRAPGDKIGRYMLRRLCGRGGMGEVWVADDPLLAIPVALKVLQSDSLGHVGVERLRREARAAAQLKHPAIVQVLDFGISPAGDAFLALELLDGENMAELAARGRVAPERVVRLMLPILDGLAHAHAHGLVHRDLKPDNLFIARTQRGSVQPKVLDFGICKSKAATSSVRLTKTGLVVGTPAYMAPEQARGDDDLDGRVDLWAIAVTMYELLTGTKPFSGATVPHLLLAILEQPAPSLRGIAGVDDELAALLERGLAKDRRDRFPNARAMGEALAAWLLRHEVVDDACGQSLRATWVHTAPPPTAIRSLSQADTCEVVSGSRRVSQSFPPIAIHRESTASSAAAPLPRRLARALPAAAACALVLLAAAAGFGSERSERRGASAEASVATEAPRLSAELPVSLGSPVISRAVAIPPSVAAPVFVSVPARSAPAHLHPWFLAPLPIHWLELAPSSLLDVLRRAGDEGLVSHDSDGRARHDHFASARARRRIASSYASGEVAE